MLEEILGKGNMSKALKRVVSNKGASGIDGMEVEELLPHIKLHWSKIRAKIMEGRYNPSAVREVEIPKPNGGKRKLGIPRKCKAECVNGINPMYHAVKRSGTE